ncbi:MAG: hypothetical protein GY750_04510 [Lentisphaerae bacterium]|nr:hypothetical protein [Lentisphaerota bacterium]MCP4100673.1 hypothetical protein [Lentisphaerota bacterium]
MSPENDQYDDDMSVQGIDSIQFSEISSLISTLDYDKAKEAIADIWQDGQNDIRIFIYKVFCDLHSNKLKNIDQHLNDIAALLANEELELEPQINLRIHIDNSLTWFFKALKQAILYINAETPDGYNPENKDKIIDQLDSIQKLMLTKYSADYQAVIDEMKSIVETAAEKNQTAPDSEELQASEQLPAEPQKPISGPRQVAEEGTKWEALRNRIEVFRQLMEEERFLEAAIYFQAINREVINFDPREYFPGIFFPLYEAMTKNFEQVLNIINQYKDTLEWHVTEQMYKINSEALAADKELLKGKKAKTFTELPDFLKNMVKVKAKEGLVSEEFMQPGSAQYEESGQTELDESEDYYQTENDNDTIR